MEVPESEAVAGPDAGAIEATPSPQPTPKIDPEDIDIENMIVGETAEPSQANGVLGPLKRFTSGISAAVEQSSALRAVADRGKDAVGLILGGGPSEVTTVTVEQGLIKLLVAREKEVVDYKILIAPERYFREGIVSDAPKVSTVLKAAMNQTEGEHKRVFAAVPGYQTNLRRLELPNAKGLDPAVLIPQEAKRTLGISTEHSHLTWHRLVGEGEMASWLVIAAANRSISSLSATAQASEVKVAAMELRAFALARAINQPDAVCAWAASDGCDVVIIRDWVPVTNQTAYWGAGSSIESTDLVNRLTQVIDSTITTHDVQNPEMTVSEDMPLYVTGTPIGKDPQVALQIAAQLRYSLAELDPPIATPPGFPLDDLIVNLGLALWDA